MIHKINAKNIVIKGRGFIAALSIALVILVAATAASAQHGYRVTKRVAFKKGAVSATLKGTIPNTLEVHEYIFRGRAGQTVKIDLSSMREDVTFYLTDDEGNHMDEGSELRSWDGELPADGDYHLFVSSTSDKPIRYALRIQIATDI
jgi:hypothetical protein